MSIQVARLAVFQVPAHRLRWIVSELKAAGVVVLDVQPAGVDVYAITVDQDDATVVRNIAGDLLKSPTSHQPVKPAAPPRRPLRWQIYYLGAILVTVAVIACIGWGLFFAQALGMSTGPMWLLVPLALFAAGLWLALRYAESNAQRAGVMGYRAE